MIAGTDSQAMAPPVLVTFAIVAYRQERFIADAVKAALAQDYSPLQIVLSDDGSPDRTFAIMEEIARGYRGPHRITLNRNPRNIGLAEHINRVMELSEGVIVVGAAGDDVSLTSRVSTLVAAWERSGRRARSLYSAVRMMDEQGNLGAVQNFPLPDFLSDLPRMCRDFMPGVAGTSHAWHREIFERFGPLAQGVAYEDRVLPLRSLLCGEVVYVSEPLVAYRRHEGAITLYAAEGDLVKDFHRQRLKHARNRLTIFDQWRRDLARVPQQLERCESSIRSEEARARFDIALEECGFAGRFLALAHALAAGVNWRYVVRWFLRTCSRAHYDRWIVQHPQQTKNTWLKS